MNIPADRNSVRRILVIKLRAVGDVLMSTIVTKNLRDAFPHATIDYLTDKSGQDVLQGNPFVDGVVLYDRQTMSGLDLIRRVRRGKYDAIFDLFGNPRTALLTLLSGARMRVGYRFRGRAYAYNIIAEPRGSRVHNTQFNLDSLEAAGIAVHDRNIHFFFSADDARYVDEFITATFPVDSFLVCLNPAGGWYTKRWGLDRYAALADRLVEEYGAKIVLAWGPGQLEDVRAIRAQMHHEGFIPPPTTLHQLGALLKRCSIVITNDSGPMHIAAAVGTPILGIYGPTNPSLQGPYGEKHVVVRNESLDCLGCNFTSCPIGHPCMLGLSVDAVLSGVRELIAKNGITT